MQFFTSVIGNDCYIYDYSLTKMLYNDYGSEWKIRSFKDNELGIKEYLKNKKGSREIIELYMAWEWRAKHTKR